MSGVDEDLVEKEFVPFLLPTSRPDLRGIAVQYFVGLTGSDDGLNVIRKRTKYVQLIADLIEDEYADIARNVSQAVVNMSTDPAVAEQLSSMQKLVRALLKAALQESVIDSEIAAMALSNLTRYEKSARSVADLMAAESCNGLGVRRLIETVTCGDVSKREHSADLLSNLTQIPEVRWIVLDKAANFFQQLLPWISYEKSLIQRRGIVATIRNCCFETEYHEWLLSDKVDLLPRLLLPLAGPEEFDDDDMEKLPVDLQYLQPDKKREPDAHIRRLLIEAVHQLCALKSCRQYIKDKNSYVILRELHNFESDASNEPNVVAAENLISLLIADEPEPGMENLNEVEIPENVARKFQQTVDSTEK